jgi:DNA helicase II / ATP-dependent DNA helicase PcrA
MMTYEEFITLVTEIPAINRNPNAEQRACLMSAPDVPTMIVAGPGSGKTTVLVLRALRHILVDRIAPERIIITTFTVKAAREIRSRLIEWGEAIFRAASERAISDHERKFLQHIDVNRVITGTLDSICQEALSSDRHSDEPPLVTLETFAAGVILQRRGGLNATYRANEPELGQFLSPFTFDGEPPETIAEAAAAMIPIIERLVQDRVDIERFGAADQPASHQLIAGIATQYRDYLKANNLLDFSSLEETLLERLTARRIPTLFQEAGALLVDEYQDTNALQEAIYFELVAVTGASFTVVGDDDQSLYRFRGATIELFRAFISRCAKKLNCAPDRPLYLVENYRSTTEIVDFFNAFVREDANFLPARIQPPKPIIKSNAQALSLPVLAMFRPDSQVLAQDLAEFLDKVFRQGGYSDPDNNFPEPLRSAKAGGDIGDAVLLGFSVLEMQKPYFGNPPRARFAHHLRQALAQRDLKMFNPRGRSLRDIEPVEQLLGLVLLTIDPPNASGEHAFEGMSITRVAKIFMRRWVDMARAFLATKPADIYKHSLEDEMLGWQQYVTNGKGEKGSSRDWPFLDVLYGLVPWLPYFENDPEGQVYLEALSRAAGQAAGFSAYSGKLLRPTKSEEGIDHGHLSVLAILRDVICPIAENAIDVDEEIMPSVPRDRLNVMTIHQAKGLEYPLVIVDVGADFKKKAKENAFRRFPEDASSTAKLEDMLAPFTGELGRLRTERSGLDRSFEDLIRLNYVAFSRPQAVLLLVGCDKLVNWKSTIKNVAVGWRQNESWSWRDQSPQPTGRKAPARVTPSNITFI